jgi:outer membrane protein OmpA-like peptidoglycan-associated protein
MLVPSWGARPFAALIGKQRHFAGIPNNLVRIVGFVGPGGSVSHVKRLSEARAKSVERYLRSKGVRGQFVLQ